MALIEQHLAKALLSLTLLLVIAVAVRHDLTEHRIPNVLTLAALAAGIAMQSLSSGAQGTFGALVGAGVGLACLLPFYFGKGMGAGDVKLMAAAGAFLGPVDAFVAALLALASGAILALAILVWRAFEVRAAAAGAPSGDAAGRAGLASIAHLRKERFPYAAAIGVGVLVTMWWRGMLEALIP